MEISWKLVRNYLEIGLSATCTSCLHRIKKAGQGTRTMVTCRHDALLLAVTAGGRPPPSSGEAASGGDTASGDRAAGGSQGCTCPAPPPVTWLPLLLPKAGREEPGTDAFSKWPCSPRTELATASPPPLLLELKAAALEFGALLRLGAAKLAAGCGPAAEASAARGSGACNAAMRSSGGPENAPFEKLNEFCSESSCPHKRTAQLLS